MTSKLQPFEHEKSRYERPNQTWSCGWTSEGEACASGPRAGGRCGAAVECTPIREGERWQCTRAPSFGGPCEDGPKPDGSCSRPITACQPVLCLRARRGQLTRWTAAATIGALLLLLSGPWRREFVSAGPLASAHSAFEADCAACHARADGGFARFLGASLGFPAGPVRDERCRTCHDLGAEADRAHSVLPDRLQKTGEESQSEKSAAPIALRLAGMFPSAIAKKDASIPCTACHRDHQGRSAKLQALSNAQCQVCHSRRFASFANGHADFALRPSRESEGVTFDHFAHAREVFTSEERDFRCRECHRPAADPRSSLSDALESVCEECHGDEFTAELPRRDERPREESSLGTPPGRMRSAGAHFTRFAHLPHRFAPGNDACATCHVFRAEGEDTDPSGSARSGFLPIRKETCARCHTPTGAGDSCLLCHVYHSKRSFQTPTPR